jgi:hypothetical protein
MSSYPIQPTFPIDVRGGRGVSVRRQGTALIVELDKSVTGELALLFDDLPWLPADPADYPDTGGLFRNGDANGYSLVRISPKA